MKYLKYWGSGELVKFELYNFRFQINFRLMEYAGTKDEFWETGSFEKVATKLIRNEFLIKEFGLGNIIGAVSANLIQKFR